MKVLMATDGSEPALRAGELAASLLHDHAAVRVRVLTVLSYTLYPYALFPGGELSDESARARAADEAVDDATRDACAIFEKAGFAVECTNRYGNAADEIVAEIDEWEPDLIVIGGAVSTVSSG
ncbi:MAG TPA: universal stress protein [Actinomycetota bacterium]|nr:universal stress protein [Actinomycetota bacterium]